MSKDDKKSHALKLADGAGPCLRSAVDYIEGRNSAPAPQAHDKCDLGRWYYETAPGETEHASHSRFPELGVVHMAFHLACDEAVRCKDAGDLEAARAALQRAADLSRQIRNALAAVLGTDA
ncbi:MAG: CZB domain-containing protein [Candidatus Aminicenantes bacterium]|nr:CZB domain-containing protein [Candidatus Aminicenantes bacterium]